MEPSVNTEKTTNERVSLDSSEHTELVNTARAAGVDSQLWRDAIDDGAYAAFNHLFTREQYEHFIQTIERLDLHNVFYNTSRMGFGKTFVTLLYAAFLLIGLEDEDEDEEETNEEDEEEPFRYEHLHIICPMGVEDMWNKTAEAFGLSKYAIVQTHRMFTLHTPDVRSGTILVVDEGHCFGNMSSDRTKALTAYIGKGNRIAVRDELPANLTLILSGSLGEKKYPTYAKVTGEYPSDSNMHAMLMTDGTKLIIHMDQRYPSYGITGNILVENHKIRLAGAMLASRTISFQDYTMRVVGACQRIEKVRRYHVTAKADEVLKSDLWKNGAKLILIGAYHVSIDHFIEWCKTNDLEYVLVNGSVTSQKRAIAMDTFNTKKKCRVFIGNLQSCGLGISLHDTSPDGSSPRILISGIDPSTAHHTLYYQLSNRHYRNGSTSDAIIHWISCAHEDVSGFMKSFEGFDAGSTAGLTQRFLPVHTIPDKEVDEDERWEYKKCMVVEKERLAEEEQKALEREREKASRSRSKK